MEQQHAVNDNGDESNKKKHTHTLTENNIDTHPYMRSKHNVYCIGIA